MIQKLKSLLTRKDKQFLLGLLFFSIFISIIETVGISIIMPFIAVSTDFTLIHSNEYYLVIFKWFNFSNDVSFIIVFGVVLILFYIFRSIINLFYFYMLSKFTDERYHLLAYRLFENYMGMAYKDFVSRNSSILTKSIVNEAANLTQVISASLLMISEIFIVIFIYAMMLYINYKITLVLTVVLILNALLMLKTVSKKIKKAGKIRAEVQTKFYEIINRSFGNFKIIKLKSNDEEMLESFADASISYAKANITNTTLSHVPRLFLEAIGFSIIIFIIIFLVWKYKNDISGSLSIISMFVLALYRLMPSVNRIMNSYNIILFNYRALDIIHNDLMYNSENLGNEYIQLNRNIVIENLRFEYDSNHLILNNINLKIEKGSKIAFIGESGSGKSTLVDVIIGLYKPQYGSILVDNKTINDSNIKSWREKIGYIPQSVYLFDGTVGENISFGSDYDKNRVDIYLKKAKIYDFFYSKNGQNTVVGEDGIMLSGGQKQRIAIARALYTNPEILVLDEATSALDDETEREIMKEIYAISSDKTLIIIAHRLSTLNGCDKIYKLEKGRIIE